MEAINFMGLLALTWLFVEGSAAVQFIKKLLNIHPESNSRSLIVQVIVKLVSCELCSGGWIGLIYYQNLLLACVVSVAAELFARLLNHILNNYLNRL
jgi:hypothetical protein